ncbi:MAG: hypothetical protein WC554_01915 [Clostridia bacterium]
MKNTKEKRFFGVFKTFADYENYIARDEEPDLDFLTDMVFLNKTSLKLMAKIACKDFNKN